jgi:putative DNA primase/helicase
MAGGRRAVGIALRMARLEVTEMTDQDDIIAAIEDGSLADVLPMPMRAEEIDALVEATKTDPGAPFERSTLARIEATKIADLPTFIRFRARLKDLKLPVGELDRALTKVNAAGGDDEAGQGRLIKFAEIEPWQEPVDGALLLGTIVVQLKRYVMLPDVAASAVALWIVHTRCFHLFNISPRLGALSPEKRCGKTTLLRFLQSLVSIAAANITAAAMFRTIEKYKPSLLIDEAVTFLPDNEELRGVINSGHEREGQVIRLVGDDHEPSAFSTFCPTAIAAIGSLTGTIEDRSITIPMRRRLPNEMVEPLRIERAEHLGELRSKIGRWVADNSTALQFADPETPEALHDRASDNWRPLLAIADCARWDWPQRARAAAVALSAQAGEQSEQSRGVLLLTDIHRIFDSKATAGGADTKRISSTGLVDALTSLG